jgi:hypothetical protein
MRRILFLLLVFFLGPILMVIASPLHAQGFEPAVLANEAIVDFPETVTFRLELEPGSRVSEAFLTYQLGQDGCLEAGTQVPVAADGSTLEWTWVMSRSGNPPPGAQMSWAWTVIDDAGNRFTTPWENLTFEDKRFDWQTIEAPVNSGATQIRLHWYEGEEVGPILLEAAVVGLERLQKDTGITLEGDVEFFIYGSSADMREALLYVQDWAGGVAFDEYKTILIGVPPRLADSWGTSTVRHELAHLVIGQYARSCLGGSLPTWLSEGLAVYAEGEPDDFVLGDIERGISEDAFQPVRSLNGAFPARDSQANMAYNQSYSLVAFLLERYGREKIQQLLLALAGAAGYDGALEQVYGFNADGLETEWRTAIGAPSRNIPPTPTPVSAAAIPTVIPLNAAQSKPTPVSAGRTTPVETPPPAEADKGADQSSGVCAPGLAPLLLAVVSGVFVPRYRKRRGR